MELTPTNPGNPLGQPTRDQLSEDQSSQGDVPQDTAVSHYRADTDSAQTSLHHTLGSNRNQASPGSHIHDGTTSNKLGGFVFDATPGNEGKTKPALSISGSRAGNAALASVIALLKNFVDFNDNTTA